jgi:hypothetical protein
MKKFIVTHQRPDLDAILSAYLLKRYADVSADVKFVPAGKTDPTAWAVVDTGGEYDPDSLRFDHHGCGPDEEDSAALQVWLYLQQQGVYINHLKPLVDLVHRGDTGSTDDDVRASYELGLHAIVSAYANMHTQKHNDHEVFNFAYSIIYALDERLCRKAMALERYRDLVVFDDHPVIALRDANSSETQCAHDEGYPLVVWEKVMPTPDGGVSFAVGVSRKKGVDTPHIGDVLKETSIYPALVDDGWYFHEGGFFAGRGIQKAQRSDPPPLSALEVAQALRETLDEQ